MTDTKLLALLDEGNRLEREATAGPWSECNSFTAHPHAIMTDIGTCQIICEFTSAWEGLYFAKGSANGNKSYVLWIANHYPALSAEMRRLVELREKVRELVILIDDSVRMGDQPNKWLGELLVTIEALRPLIQEE